MPRSCQAYDNASESIQAVEAAELKFQNIINSLSVDAACRKIDDLAEKKQLDCFELMLIKAWFAAKESNMMKDEAEVFSNCRSGMKHFEEAVLAVMRKCGERPPYTHEVPQGFLGFL